jgi:DNA-binding PadR family transcriptional regulator
VSRRGDVLELAVLGLLHDTPMHGYELRKRLNVLLGAKLSSATRLGMTEGL